MGLRKENFIVSTPDPEEIAALNAYHSGDPDYQPAMSQEEVLKELGL